jgi:hypothetical protein
MTYKNEIEGVSGCHKSVLFVGSTEDRRNLISRHAFNQLKQKSNLKNTRSKTYCLIGLPNKPILSDVIL